MNCSSWWKLTLIGLSTVGVLAACGGGSDDSSGASANSDPTLVTTDKGAVQGVSNATTITFLGIPYAAAPTGALRFMAPQPRAAWTTTLQASAPGSDCPQSPRGPGVAETNEDCLFLNVTVPKTTTTRKPVLVMIHGGGFSGGRGASYDGTWLANAGDVILVSVNYRLGLLGYLAHSSLDDGTGNTGNYGLEDQQAALRWVKTNIAQFGGDPSNVTLGGLSAGAMSTCNHLASPASQGLFSKAIVESGPCAFNWDTLEQKFTEEATLPAQLGCTGSESEIAACLRSPTLNISTVLSVQQTAGSAVLFPSVGGADIPTEPRLALGRVPLLLGNVILETGPGMQPANDTAYLAALTTTYGATDAAQIIAEYPSSGTYLAGASAIGQANADFNPTPGAPEISVCNDVRTFQLSKAAGGQPIYGWEFADIANNSVTHTSHEKYLYPLFSDTYPPAGTALPAASQALSDTMVQYWANFIKSGNPNGPNLPNWPPYSAATDIMQLRPGAVGIGIDESAEHRCDFWQSLGLAL